ncbi:MAG: helix-turn-helix domain-containing protein [Pseudonocardia sp.]
MSEPSRVRRQLAAELVRLRAPRRISGRRMAELLGVSQATISRMDRGGGPVPSDQQIEIWLQATGSGQPARDRIAMLITAARNEATSWPELLAEHHGNLQGYAHTVWAAAREADAIRVRNFQPTVIAGLLQTIPYTRALLPLTDLTGGIDHEATLVGRLERQRVLFDSRRAFQFLILESVLRRSPGDGIMPAQRDRIGQLAELPTVEVAVLPDAAMVATPWHGFNLYEQSSGSATVFLELIHRTEEVAKPEHVELYRKLWDRLWAAAATGVDAVALIRTAAG